MGDSSARVHMNDNSSDEHKSYRRIASGRRWSISRRRADTGASPTLSMRASGAGWAPGSGAGEIGDSFATKLTMPDVLDEEVRSPEPKKSRHYLPATTPTTGLRSFLGVNKKILRI